MRPQRVGRRSIAVTGAVLSMLFVLPLLAGCRSGGADREAGASDGSRPIQLRRDSGGAGGDGGVARTLDRTAVERAVENYRINKNRAESPYKLAGADLDGDGVAEAVVLFEGGDWCARTGCSMAIFKSGPRGYKPAFRTVRVKPPVLVSRESASGWRDLLVWTGGAGTAPKRRVLLRFSGTGYPRNAMLEPEVPLGTALEVEVLIEAPAVRPGGSAQGGARSNP